MHGAIGPGGFKDIILFLATAAIVAPLFQRLRLSPILGLLLAGVALGPHGLGQLAVLVTFGGGYSTGAALLRRGSD